MHIKDFTNKQKKINWNPQIPVSQTTTIGVYLEWFYLFIAIERYRSG